MAYRDSLEEFYEALCKYKDPHKDYPRDEYDRHSFCTLVSIEKPEPHFFDMREFKWNISRNNSYHYISINSCNWTITSGLCWLELTESSLKNWIILEEDKSFQVLYGR